MVSTGHCVRRAFEARVIVCVWALALAVRSQDQELLRTNVGTDYDANVVL